MEKSMFSVPEIEKSAFSVPGHTKIDVFFKSPPAETFMTSIVFAFQHGFCRAKAHNHGSHKIHVRLLPATLPNFPGRIDVRDGREPEAPARRQSRAAGKKFFITSVVRAPKPTFSEVSSTFVPQPIWPPTGVPDRRGIAIEHRS